MEEYLTSYKSVVAEIKSIISSGQETAYMPPARQCYLLIGILENEL